MMMKINEMVTVDTSPVEHDDGDDNEMMTVDTSPVQRLQLSSVALSSKAILSKMWSYFCRAYIKSAHLGTFFFFYQQFWQRPPLQVHREAKTNFPYFPRKQDLQICECWFLHFPWWSSPFITSSSLILLLFCHHFFQASCLLVTDEFAPGKDTENSCPFSFFLCRFSALFSPRNNFFSVFLSFSIYFSSVLFFFFFFFSQGYFPSLRFDYSERSFKYLVLCKVSSSQSFKTAGRDPADLFWFFFK